MSHILKLLRLHKNKFVRPKDFEKVIIRGNYSE